MRISFYKVLIAMAAITLYSNTIYGQCGCKFTITNEFSFDGIAKGVQPGDKICVASGERSGILFTNIVGTAANPVIITNVCTGGEVFFNAPSNWGNCVTFEKSKHYRFTGSSNPNLFYGIKVSGATMGIQNYNLSTDFEIDHIHVTNTGCQGIAAKTDPKCDPATQFPNFTMRNTSFHDLKIENTGCEGFYIGNSHYDHGTDIICGGVSTTVFEHAVDNVKVYNCILNNIGNDGIQVGSATNVIVYDNTIIGTGIKNNNAHQNGIQMGDGTTKALVYNNYVDQARGYGIFDTGGGGTYYNNIVLNSLLDGIFLRDDALTGVPAAPGHASTGFTIVNNTIINSLNYAVYNLSENPNMSYFYNNIVVNQKTPYIYLNNANVKWTAANNIQTLDINSPKFVNAPAKDFHLTTNSTTALNLGKDVGYLGINSDFDGQPRPNGSGYDIGAFEFQAGGPTSNAGADKSITLPTNSIILNGTGTSSTGITGYLWTKKSGGAATLTNETTANLSVSGLVQGTYVFEFRVIDASGFAFDEATVNVLPIAANQNPTANAGTDKTITLPTSTLIINGIGTDPDGSIASYLWTKVSGPAATLTNATTPNLSLSNLLQGTYVFQLTVTDDKSATASDQVTVTVNAAATNQIPTVNAGSQKTVFLPTNQVVITATASDPDGSISSILWEKKSGGAATLTNTNTLTLTASSLTAGSYTFRITVTDDKGATNFSEVVVNVIQANQSPTSNAGADQSITLPTNSVVLAGSGIDADGSIIGYAWTKVSGPAATLTNTNTATLTVTSMVQGIYVFGLTVTDNNGATGNDQVIVSVNSATPGPNEIPIALAGGNVSFSLPTNSVNLFGAGFDPDGAIVSYAWTKASGGSAILTNADKPTLTVTNLQAGQYTFRLTVTDNAGATDDDIAIVTVSALGTNIFPVASAGLDKIVKLPLTSVTLIGSGTDEDGQIVGYAWTQTSGSPATIVSPTTSSTTISGLAEGDYTFRLTVTDNSGATDLNEVTVRVVTSTSNLPPVVDAGPDLKIFSPQNTLIINSTASDDGTIVGYQWVKLSGPSVTLLNPSEQNLSLTNLVEGDYSFQLTVTDNNGASVFDIVKVSLLPATFNPPVADAGVDQEITLPVNQVNLVGTASSPTGSIVSTVWTKSIGPTATLAGATTLNLQCTNMVAGTYVFKLTATDNTGNEVSDNVQVIVNPIPPNQIPIVNPGQNYSLTLPASQVTLTGSATDTDGTVISVEWSLISGPNSPILQNALSLTLTATNLIEGLYIFRLSAKDNEGATGYNDVLVFLSNPTTTNQPPIAYAGDDIVLTLPENSVAIQGNGIDPGGYITSYTWEQVGGTPTAFTTSGEQFLEVTDMVEGEYTFRLTVTDTALSAFDDVKISVIGKSDEIPKFFSPNGDGYGETWVIRNIDSYQTCDLIVFSRSGQNVLQTRAYQNNWDGTYNGKRLADGDYYYVFNCDDGRKIKGALRIIR
jgi:gliding motility-associated-like protein